MSGASGNNGWLFPVRVCGCASENHGTKRSYLPSAIPVVTIWSCDDSEPADHGIVEGEPQVHGLRSVQAGFDLVENSVLRMQGKVELVAGEGLVGAGEDEMMPETYHALHGYKISTC